MIIMLLGQGALYRLHHERQQMLTKLERKRAVRIACSLVVVITIVLLWNLKS
jgi:hypothetical protein